MPVCSLGCAHPVVIGTDITACNRDMLTKPRFRQTMGLAKGHVQYVAVYSFDRI